jgi:hypothetical protein
MRSHELGSALAAVLLLCGCTATTGTGQGALSSPSGVSSADESWASVGAERGQAPVEVRWRADGDSVTEGALTLVVPGRGTFEGRYLQASNESAAVARNPYLDPLEYPNWQAHAAKDPSWEPGYETRPTVEYSGWMDADLRSEAGDTMHCRFRLTEPHLGPAGGGTGACDLPSGETIENIVLAR